MAVSAGKPILPFRVADAVPSGSLALHLSRRHWLDALTPPLEQHLQRLAEAVERILPATEPASTPAEAPRTPEQEPGRPAAPQAQRGAAPPVEALGTERAARSPVSGAEKADAGERTPYSAALLSLPARYRCEGEVARTDFSAVFRVDDTAEANVRALKVTDLRRLPGPPSRLSALTDHPRIPRSHASWQHDHFHYEVTDFVHGWPLHTLLAANPQGLGEAWVEAWAVDLLDIVVHLHSLSPPIIHRDIKPANCIIERIARHLVLIDMSLAIHPSPGEKLAPIASTGYAAPEQYRGEYSTASDVYGWGATVHAVLTGQPPADAALREVGRGLPMAERLEQSRAGAFVLRALALAPEEREEASKLLRELRHATEQTQVVSSDWLSGEFPELEGDWER